MFDVYVSGEVLESSTREDAVGGLCRLFSIKSEQAEKLLDGQRHRVKSGVEKAVALKYRDALASAGAAVVIERAGSVPADSAPAGREATGSDVQGTAGQPASESQEQHILNAKAKPDAAPPQFSAFDPGDKPIDFSAGAKDASADKSAETHAGAPAAADALSLAPVGANMSEGISQRPYVLVSAPELDVAPAGEEIPTLPSNKELLSPETDHLHLAPIDGA